VELAPSEAQPDTREMEKDVMLALREELNFTIGRQQLGRAMLRLLFIFGSNGIPLSRDYSLMAKALVSIEEVGRTLDPEFDIRIYAKPVLEPAAARPLEPADHAARREGVPEGRPSRAEGPAA
jgi:ubiquinone biosynthesis protein